MFAQVGMQDIQYVGGTRSGRLTNGNLPSTETRNRLTVIRGDLEGNPNDDIIVVRNDS